MPASCGTRTASCSPTRWPGAVRPGRSKCSGTTRCTSDTGRQEEGGMNGQDEDGFPAAQDESGERVIGRLWERNYDGVTASLLESLPFRDDWDCLDLGAGTGSMARWMAQRAKRGSV